MMFEVYLLIDARPGIEKVGYVGITKRGIGVRLKQHLKDAKRKNGPCQTWLRAHLKKDSAPKVVLLQSMVPPDKIESAERQWLANFRAMGWELKNATDGGEINKVVSLGTREKQRQAKLKNPMCYWQGKKRDPVMIRAIAEQFKRTYTYINPNGILVTFHGLSAFCKENELDPSSMGKLRRGKIQKYKGWTYPKT